MRQSRIVSKVASSITGYDVFISYRHADAHDYAIALEGILESKGLMVFRDESEEDAGVPLETFIKRACSARTFIVLATPTVFRSSNVLAELSGYLTQRIDKWYKRPFSRVISINVAQALSNAPSKPREWKRLSDFVYEPETLEAIDNATPSKAVVERLLRAGSFMRSWRRFIFIMAILFFGILLSIAVTSLYLQSVVRDLSRSRIALLEAQQESAKLVSSNHLLDEQNERLKTSADSLKEEGEKLKESNSTLASQNNILISQSDQLIRRNSILSNRNRGLVTQASQLEQKANALSLQSTMLQTRIAAQNQLTEDPLLAYRLAVEAYKLSPEPANRKLILSAISRIDLFYNYQKKGYSIEDFKEPFILLSGAGKEAGGKSFLLFDMNSLETHLANIKASHAWIVPTDKAYKLLTQNWIGSGLDAIATYQLFDTDGNPLSEAIRKGGLSQIKFLNNSKVSFPLYGDRKILVWDLASNTREFIQQDTSKKFDTYYYSIYGALDTRSDGVSAAHYRNGLVLVDKHGKIQTESYTEVDFDPSSFFSAAKWSPDGHYLALNYFDRKRLGIWDPVKKLFIWLDPDKWIVESYSWSLDGHQLAFSGRTENDIDVTVEIVDANSPEQSRRIIHTGNVPIRSVVFLPGNTQLAISDREGNILILQISNGQILKAGRQEGVTRLFSTQNAFYSSSPNSFRIWSTKPAPSKHWLFQSSGKRVYLATGAADPSWYWLAVPFVDNKITGGIELRRIQNGEKYELSVPDPDSINLEFSENGKWLVLQTLKNLRIYNTSSWNYHDFALQQNDHQFITLRMVSDIVYAHTLGGDRMNNTSDEYDYIIKLSGQQPTLTSRVYSKDKEDDKPDQDLLKKEIDGWELDKLYKYRSAGIKSSPKSGWAYYIKCRDQPLGASDCDVQFLPTNLERIMGIYDSLLWKPTDEELKAWRP